MPIKIDDARLKAALKRKMGVGGLKLGLSVAALDVANEFKIAPPQPASGRTQADNWTPKQRRGFFYHLNKGDIEVPYRRGLSKKSQKLEQSWTNEAQNNGLTQVIGTAVGYAKLVQSAAKQTRWHKVTGWRTEEQIIKAKEANVNKTVAYYIEKDL